MKLNKTFFAIVTVALTIGINVSAMANVTPNQEVQKENNNPMTETTQPESCRRTWFGC